MDDNESLLIPLFLYTMQDYERITTHISVSEGLRRFNFTSAATADALVSHESDSVAIDVRLMLQRKYFQRDEGLHWRKLLKAARSNKFISECALDDISQRMQGVHEQPIELALSDGSTISEQYKNAEDVTYGSLLHGQVDRVMRSLKYPTDMRLLSLAPYVLAREELLLELRDLCIEAGVKPLGYNVDERAAVLRRERSSDSGPRIKKSPFWSNVIGRDADEKDLEIIAKSNSLDDNIAFLVASEFFILLRDNPLNRQSLRKLIWKRNWLAWGNFETAARIVRAIEKPGASTRVMHEGGDRFAQVKILPNIIEPWMTDVPQLLSNTGCVICLTKRGSAWKVNGMMTPGGIK